MTCDKFYYYTEPSQRDVPFYKEEINPHTLQFVQYFTSLTQFFKSPGKFVQNLAPKWHLIFFESRASYNFKLRNLQIGGR